VKIGVVLNPNALGVRRRVGLRGKLLALLDGIGELVETRTPADVDAVVRRFLDGGAQVIATCGGDGTNLSVLTSLVRIARERLPTFAILRGGTVNTIAENLAVRGEPEQLLARLIEAVRAGDVHPRGQDLLEVRMGDEPPMYGFLFAAAMGARFLEAYYGGPITGPAWAGVLAARTIGSALVVGPFARWLFSPVDVELEVDGEIVREPARPRLLLASTVPDVGIGMKVTWQAGRQPGRFNLISSSLSTVSMALQIERVLGGRPLRGNPHHDVQAREAVMRFARPEPFTLDGELFRESRVEISAGPRVWIARP
jgi:diacylglycerol kinase family enzyme